MKEKNRASPMQDILITPSRNVPGMCQIRKMDINLMNNCTDNACTVLMMNNANSFSVAYVYIKISRCNNLIR